MSVAAKKRPAVGVKKVAKKVAKTVPPPTKTAAKLGPAAKLPKTLAQCADLLYKTREDRLKLKREVDALEGLESALKQHLIAELPKARSSGIAGKSARVSLDKKVVPTANDWSAVHKYIAKNCVKNPGVFALLQKRLNDEAVKEIWESGKVVPGVERFEVTTVSCTKLS